MSKILFRIFHLVLLRLLWCGEMNTSQYFANATTNYTTRNNNNNSSTYTMDLTWLPHVHAQLYFRAVLCTVAMFVQMTGIYALCLMKKRTNQVGPWIGFEKV